MTMMGCVNTDGLPRSGTSKQDSGSKLRKREGMGRRERCDRWLEKGRLTSPECVNSHNDCEGEFTAPTQ